MDGVKEHTKQEGYLGVVKWSVSSRLKAERGESREKSVKIRENDRTADRLSLQQSPHIPQVAGTGRSLSVVSLASLVLAPGLNC